MSKFLSTIITLTFELNFKNDLLFSFVEYKTWTSFLDIVIKKHRNKHKGYIIVNFVLNIQKTHKIGKENF